MEAKHVVAGLATLSLVLAHAYLLPQRRGAVGAAAWPTAAAFAGLPLNGQGRRGVGGGGVYALRASSTLHAPGPATNR